MRQVRRRVDLSHVIRPGMPVYPGTESPLFQTVAYHVADGYREKRITMFSHVGTHMDAPAHVLADGRTLDQLPMESFAGAACVVDVRAVGEQIDLATLERYETAIAESDFVLLWSGWDEYWGRREYFQGFPVLTQEAARWLVNAEIRGVGLDMISPDRLEDSDLPIHHILLGAEIVLVENLTGLGQLPVAGFELACYPIKLVSADGAPVRAVAHLFRDPPETPGRGI